MIRILQEMANASALQMQEPESSQPLPPASLQTFLQNSSAATPEAIRGVVLADHQQQFQNKYITAYTELMKWNAMCSVLKNRIIIEEHITDCFSALIMSAYQQPAKPNLHNLAFRMKFGDY